MFRYKLRTLLIVLALGPVVLAGAWWCQSTILDFVQSFPVGLLFGCVLIEFSGMLLLMALVRTLKAIDRRCRR
jgi:hypothetical protein